MGILRGDQHRGFPAAPRQFLYLAPGLIFVLPPDASARDPPHP